MRRAACLLVVALTGCLSSPSGQTDDPPLQKVSTEPAWNTTVRGDLLQQFAFEAPAGASCHLIVNGTGESQGPHPVLGIVIDAPIYVDEPEGAFVQVASNTPNELVSVEAWAMGQIVDTTEYTAQWQVNRDMDFISAGNGTIWVAGVDLSPRNESPSLAVQLDCGLGTVLEAGHSDGEAILLQNRPTKGSASIRFGDRAQAGTDTLAWDAANGTLLFGYVHGTPNKLFLLELLTPTGTKQWIATPLTVGVALGVESPIDTPRFQHRDSTGGAYELTVSGTAAPALMDIVVIIV